MSGNPNPPPPNPEKWEDVRKLLRQVIRLVTPASGYPDKAAIQSAILILESIIQYMKKRLRDE